MRRGASALAVLLLTFAMALEASSAAEVTDRGSVSDANDTSQGIDISSVLFVTRKDPRSYTVRIRAYEQIEMPEDMLVVRLDTFGGPRWDYGMHIWFDPGSPTIYCDMDQRRYTTNPRHVIYPEGWDVSGNVAWCRVSHLRRNKPVRLKVWSNNMYEREVDDRAPDNGLWYP